MRQLRILFAMLPSALAGCAIGYNQALFTTKSNVGVDIDSTPPTAEVSIARREGVIEPSFEGGKTPPVMAGFASKTNLLSAFLFGVDARFAGGDAAKNLEGAIDGESGLCLSKAPVGHVFGHTMKLPGPGEIEPFFFATDTSLGVKIAWSGMTGGVPDTVKVGFHRKEFALASVFGEENSPQCAGDTNHKYLVKMPSFLAAIDQDVSADANLTGHIGATQHFATGDAATLSALNPKMKLLMHEDLGTAYVASASSAKDVGCLNTWMDADQAAHSRELMDWWARKHQPGNGMMLMSTDEFAYLRKEFLAEKRIQCP